LALFLKEQYSHHERQVLEELEKNVRLKVSLANASESAEKLRVLEGQIEVDPNVDQLREIIRTASRREMTLEDALNDLSPITRVMFLAIRSLNQALRIVAK